jgi:PAS domain S-box-containing protein
MRSAPHITARGRGVGPAPSRTGPLAAACVVALIVFFVDIVTPLGADIGVLYVIPLLLTAFAGSARITFLAAAQASILTLVGAVLSPASGTFWLAAANRLTALLVIWTTTAILTRFERTGTALDQRTKDLADVSYAIDQSAIVAVTDVKGTIQYVNKKFCEISKYSREELIGQDHRIINSGYHPKEFIRDLWTTIANGRIWRGEIRNRAKDGSIYWVDTTIVPFMDERGKPYQYMAIRYEVTDRKRSEERLREQTALARLGEMAAVVAHEVKNPIAGIRGALQVIASRMAPDQRDRAVMGDIITRLDGLNAIVQDLLVFARPRPVRAEHVDVAALVRGTADLIRRDPALAAVDVRVDVDRAASAIVQADPEQLQMVFQNVLINAAQAMNGLGHISVTIGDANGRCRLSIADHGPGMPADVRNKAFDPFFTTKHRGTGLGLPIAKRIIDAHGGEIRIETPPGGGTVVSIDLPATR